MKIRLSIIILSLIGLSACGPTTDVILLDETPREKTMLIDVYTNYGAIIRKYKEIATISVSDEGWDRKESQLIEKLKTKAREMGANAIVLQGVTETDTGSVPVGGVWFKINERIVRAIAIVYTD